MYISVIPYLKNQNKYNRFQFYSLLKSTKKFSESDPIQKYKTLISQLDPNWQTIQQEKKKKYEFI